MDKNQSLTITWEEWRDYLQMYPHGGIEDILTYWRSSLVSLGGLWKERGLFGNVWVHIIATCYTKGVIASYMFTSPESTLKTRT